MKAQPSSENFSLPSNERYEVHGLLGRGGMALVYEATDSVTSQRVALKRLQTLPEPAKQQRNAELFEREFHTLSQLAQPRALAQGRPAQQQLSERDRRARDLARFAPGLDQGEQRRRAAVS